jgi:hypothetical protein
VANVQLSENEQTCVYFSTLTGRILGFGHASMAPVFTEGWRREVLYHASAIDRMADRYRAQELEDSQREDFERTEREAPARNAIRQALMDRRNHVDGGNRQFIDVSLRLMDQRAERARQRKQQTYLLCEKYDASRTQEDIALDCPAFGPVG